MGVNLHIIRIDEAGWRIVDEEVGWDEASFIIDDRFRAADFWDQLEELERGEIASRPNISQALKWVRTLDHDERPRLYQAIALMGLDESLWMWSG